MCEVLEGEFCPVLWFRNLIVNMVVYLKQKFNSQTCSAKCEQILESLGHCVRLK